MISMSELKAALRLDTDDENILLRDLEKSAVAFIERKTGHYFGEPKTVTEIVSGGRPSIWLAGPPVSVTSVEYLSGEAWTAFDDADYMLDSATIYHAGLWPRGTRNLRVTYTAGYEPGTEPEDIRQAVRLLVAHWYLHRTATADEETKTEEMPFMVNELIAPYRIPVIA